MELGELLSEGRENYSGTLFEGKRNVRRRHVSKLFFSWCFGELSSLGAEPFVLRLQQRKVSSQRESHGYNIFRRGRVFFIPPSLSVSECLFRFG